MTSPPQHPFRPRSGRLSLPGFDQPVELHTDAVGVPSVTARTRADLYRAQGFLHQTERAWQIDVESRVALGRSAALLGPGALMSDALFARLGFAERARSVVDAADPEVKQVFEWYADGLRAGRTVVPTTAEHSFLGVDVPLPSGEQAHERAVALLLGLGFSLQHDWLLNLIRAAVDPDTATVTDGDAPSAADVLLAVQRNLGPVGSTAGSGSNAWAVPRPDGAPMICGDPHLDARLPGHWMPMRLTAPGYDVVGGSLPGLPDLLFGYNGQVGWAVTFAPAHTTRLVLERLTPDGTKAVRASGEVPVASSTVAVEVRGFGTERVTCRRTDRGRLLGLELSGRTGRWRYDLAFDSAQWVDPYPQTALSEAATARTVADLADALRGWRSVPQSVVCADSSGAVGVVQTGAGLDQPEPGALLAGWRLDGPDDLTVRSRHQLVSGTTAVVAANHRPDGCTEAGHWEAPLRAGRIRTMLAEGGPAGTAQQARIQLDLRSSLADLLLDDALAAVRDEVDAGLEPHVSALATWDRQLYHDAPEPLIFAHWLAEIARGVASAAAPPVADLFVTAKAWLTEWGLDLVSGRIRQDGSADLLVTALRRALDAIRAEQGDDPRRWSWGRRHRIAARHRLAGMLPAGTLPEPEPMPGADDSVCRGDVNSPPVVGPSFRMIVDLTDPDRSVWSFPHGVSGVVSSGHFQDQVPAWRVGRYHPVAWSDPARERSATAGLLLDPAP